MMALKLDGYVRWQTIMRVCSNNLKVIMLKEVYSS